MSTPTICHVSTFAPTQCGIATYVGDLVASLPNWKAMQVALTFASAREQPLQQDLMLGLEVDAAPRRAYVAVAEAINDSGCDLVLLQHEFGIFGGNDGEYIVDLAAAIRKALVITLHTVPPALSEARLSIVARLVQHATKLVVLSPQDASVLTSLLPEAAAKVEVVRHGVPDTPFRYPRDGELRRRIESKLVFVSAGHIRPSKGYHVALQALALLRVWCPDFKYLILGRAQPQCAYGPTYRGQIRALVRQLGLEDRVVWMEEYVPLQTLIDRIAAADVGLVTYTQEDQSSSGVLPLMLAVGRPVVATGFAYAARLASEIPGLYVAGSNDPASICATIAEVVHNPDNLRRDMRRCHAAMRPYVWSRTGEAYARVFRASLAAHGACTADRTGRWAFHPAF